MTIDGAILTADSHGDKFQCNTRQGRAKLVMAQKVGTSKLLSIKQIKQAQSYL